MAGRRMSLWRQFKQVILLVWDGFWDNNLSLAASSLAYQTMLALVPLLAIGLALLKASGKLDDDTGNSLVQLLVTWVFPSSPDAQQKVARQLYDYSGRLTTGALGSFGLITASVIGYLLFLSVESIWNRIWDSQRERGYIERFLYFYTGVTLAPFIAAVSFLNAAKVFQSHLFPRLLSIAAMTAGITLLNRFTPTLRVEWKPALVGGVVSAVLFEGAKWGLGVYLRFFTSRYESLYGTLAVLPLFLLSIYLWWVILLIGAELCRAIQRLPLLRQMVQDKKRAGEHSIIHSTEMPTVNGPMAARLLCDVAQYWKSGKKAIPILELEQRHGLPESIVRRVMKRLTGKGYIAEMEDSYILATPPENIPLDAVLQLFADFSPPSYDHSEPDALDRVLQGLDDTIRTKSSNITFANLI